ncbi:MAG: hypothetical protein OEZ57_03615 [Nitrospirota bacterium]|nr:hypothetical protein [Nitrospirota bacterium]MDH5585239.1 hypothetical protein [Nitrospirota bacterium]MDH5773988.1 hypothetical protein [Nitrospirota bacterium]
MRAHGAQHLEGTEYLPGRVQVLHEEAIPATHRPSGYPLERHGLTIEGPYHALGRGLLGHRAMEGTVPGFVVVWMARAAGCRPDPV